MDPAVGQQVDIELDVTKLIIRQALKPIDNLVLQFDGAPSHGYQDDISRMVYQVFYGRCNRRSAPSRGLSGRPGIRHRSRAPARVADLLDDEVQTEEALNTLAEIQ